MQGIILCKKHLLTVCLLLSGTVSQASMSPPHIHQDGLAQIAAQTATLNELVLAKTRTVSKPKSNKIALSRTKRQQIRLINHDIDDSDDDFGAELDFHVAYRRPELIKHKVPVPNEDVSDYVAERLAQSRALAMARYKEVWSQNN